MTGVVAVGAIAVILTPGSPGGGVAHTVVMSASLGPYKWAPDLEKNAGLPTLATSVAEMGGGQMSGIRARTYERSAPGGAAPQLLEVIGGRLPSTSPAWLTSWCRTGRGSSSSRSRRLPPQE